MAVAILIGWACVAEAQAQENKLATRYNIAVEIDAFPQKTPEEALASVLKSIQTKRVDYLLAQLSDPAFVDKRVKEVHGGKFEDMVKEATQKLLDDPETVTMLRRYAKEGKWEKGDDTASATLKDSKDVVYFRKLEGRWFMENRKKAEK
jgi:hypothetical protein